MNLLGHWQAARQEWKYYVWIFSSSSFQKRQLTVLFKRTTMFQSLSVKVCITLYELCAFPVRIRSPSEDAHFWWGTSPSSVRMFTPAESHRHSKWGCLFHCNSSSPGMHILTENAHSLYRVCICTSISWYFKKICRIAFQELEKNSSNDFALLP